MTLQEYLSSLAGRTPAFGECDCMLIVADWVRQLTGYDEGAHYRGTYNDEMGWRNVVMRAGGPVMLVDEACARLGLRCTLPAPRAGDVGVVAMPSVGHIGAICGGARWIVMTTVGLAALSVSKTRVLTAWGVR